MALRVILFLTIFVSLLTAQSGNWIYLAGNSVHDIAENSNGRIFRIDKIGKIVFYTDDKGETWQQIILEWQPESITVDRFDRLWVGTKSEHLLRSSDNGATWDDYPCGEVTDVYVAGNNSIVAAGCWEIFVSFDDGNNWIKSDIQMVGIDKVFIYGDSTLFASRKNELKRSTNLGAEWETVFQNTYNDISMVNDSVIYVSCNDILYSTDGGNQWNLMNTDSYRQLEVFSDSVLFWYDDNIVFYSEDFGVTSHLLGNPFSLGYSANLLKIQNSIAMIDDGKLVIYDLTENISDDCYLPLEVGNQWLFVERMNNCLIDTISIIDKSVIDGKSYYLDNTGRNIRYDSTNSNLYIYYDGYGEKLYMDFSLSQGALMYQWLTGDWYHGGRIEEYEASVFGKQTNIIGFEEFEEYSWHYQYYAKNIGFVQENIYYQYSSARKRNLLEALIVRDGDHEHYSNGYTTEISGDYIIQYNNSSPVSVEFDLNHPNSILSTQNYIGVSFLDTVWFCSFYSNGANSTDTVKQIITPVSNVNHYKFDVGFDEQLLARGYQFYYSYLIKSKGLTGKTERFPETGWYDLNPTDIENNGYNQYSYDLSQNYPNPFNPETVISYSVAESSNVLVEVFNLLGEKVTTLVNEYKNSGEYSVKFNGVNLPAGLYLYRITAGKFVHTKKMLLIK